MKKIVEEHMKNYSFILPEQDRAYIENKYHNTNESFNAFRHRQYHGYEYDSATGLSDNEINTGLAKLVKQLEGKSRYIIKARTVEYVLDNTRIDVNENDYFPGIYSWGRLIDAHTINPWHQQAYEETKEALGSNYINDYSTTGTVNLHLDFDHTVPDYNSLMKLGFRGILARAQASYDALNDKHELSEEQKEFFAALTITYEAILRFIDRLYNYSLTKSSDKQKRISESLKNLWSGAPKTTYDALMMIYLYFMISESIDHYQVRSLGYGLDATLYSFYKKDIQNGTFTEEEIATFIVYFLLQFSAMGNYWGQPMYLAGTNPDGSTKVNELTYLILDVYDELDIYNPKIQIKVNRNTPKDFILKALEMIRHGSNSIVFCNEETIVKALMRQGATYERALDSVVKGCYEYVTKADTLCISFNTVNALKPVALVFNNGVDLLTGIKLGVETGDVAEFKSFEEFYSAYRRQFVYVVRRALEGILVFETHVNRVNPSVLYSATIPQCVEKMIDANNGGINNVSSMWLNGLGSATDALMAVYELVFEKGETTLKELKQALQNNWVGYEKLRLKALNCKHKYGNGDKLADSYANAIHQLFSAQFSGLKNCHGGNFEYELHSARAYIGQGRRTEATADGRKHGDETSKNASPTAGMDKNGITALIASATNMDLSLADSGTCLDVMLHPSAVQGEDGLEILYNVLQTYMKKGGASIHFNIFNKEMLLDAQKNPDKYKNLQVRVCGWNVLWNNMSKKEQDAYILRAENIQ
ncbi:MAG: pyruvate formate lyase family protein [Oscillospiraceae bacterium]|nr:pyruvate formate lyase family protein [Oscillospiraceae bacterium]